MRKLWYDTGSSLCLDSLLLIVSQTGVFIYAAFSIIGTFFQLEEHTLAFLASLATLLQTTMQTLFILDATSRLETISGHLFWTSNYEKTIQNRVKTMGVLIFMLVVQAFFARFKKAQGPKKT